MKKKPNYFLLIFTLLMGLSGCTPPTSGNTALVVQVANMVDVSLGITKEGVVITSAGVTIPLIRTGILNVGWRTGVEWARESAQTTPNTLYVVYAGESNNSRQDVYDIGQPFSISFQENEWARTIEKLPNGAIIVVVETRIVETRVEDEQAPATSAPIAPIDSCPGAETQRVKVGDTVEVCTKSDNLIIREDPSLSSIETFRISPGARVVIVNGPACANDSSWWLVEVPSGVWVRRGDADAPLFQSTSTTMGWVREGSDAIDKYFICNVE